MEKILLVSNLTRWSEKVEIIKETDTYFEGYNALHELERYEKKQWVISPTYAIVGGVNRYWEYVKGN